MVAHMQERKVWWKSSRVALIALATVVAGTVPLLMPEKKPRIVEPEAEIYLKPVDGRGIMAPLPQELHAF
jgi:hypothetical protein